MDIRPFAAENSTLKPLPLQGQVALRHPGYPDDHNGKLNIIAQFSCFDQDSSTGRWGFHRGTLTTIAFILSGNKPGRLLPSRLAPGIHFSVADNNDDHDEVLLGSYYYFYPFNWLQEEVPYAIVRSFRDYTFPHSLLPPFWNSLFTPAPNIYGFSPSLYSATVRARDDTCRVSGGMDGLEVAHLVPRIEVDWFRENNMAIYNESQLLAPNLQLSDQRNCWLLRSDIYSVFDLQRAFALVPKARKIVIHFLARTRQLGALYHNREPALTQISPEFAFARLAWAVIPLSATFTTTKGRRIRIFDTETSVSRDIDYQPVLPVAPQPVKKRTRTAQLTSKDRQNLEDFESMSSFREEASISEYLEDRLYASEAELASSAPKLDAIFHALSPEARYNITYYPGVFEIERMKEQYLREHEGELHEKEVIRRTREVMSQIFDSQVDMR